jgi:RPA family protein|uniref:Rpa-associated protein n=1 Tax=uncultured Poseidoniia archaeon TaxID=1697135 RepID=A0A1B1TBE8_9ARCH|nr:rpa-associated protein [uncultured Candidatus Thalassoarchaea sp.]
MGGAAMMNQVRFGRQSAIRIFAQEYSDSNLPLEGVGEYAPSFIITKLGAKVNRALFGGVIDRFERREGDNGPTYSGHLRDATGGVHRFQIAPFQPELHADAEELLARFESGDRFLMMMIGRARWFESDDGGIFTSFRAEEFTTVERSVYVNWLVEASAATLRRLDAYNLSLESENTNESLKSAGVPADLIEGMILAKNHYSSFDPENYKVGVLQSLSMALSSNSEIEQMITSTEESTVLEVPENSPQMKNDAVKSDSKPTGDVDDVILNVIRSSSNPDGMPYDSIVLACVEAGFSRESSEDAIEDLRDIKCEIIEPRFGFFQILD